MTIATTSLIINPNNSNTKGDTMSDNRVQLIAKANNLFKKEKKMEIVTRMNETEDQRFNRLFEEMEAEVIKEDDMCNHIILEPITLKKWKDEEDKVAFVIELTQCCNVLGQWRLAERELEDHDTGDRKEPFAGMMIGPDKTNNAITRNTQGNMVDTYALAPAFQAGTTENNGGFTIQGHLRDPKMYPVVNLSVDGYETWLRENPEPVKNTKEWRKWHHAQQVLVGSEVQRLDNDGRMMWRWEHSVGFNADPGQSWQCKSEEYEAQRQGVAEYYEHSALDGIYRTLDYTRVGDARVEALVQMINRLFTKNKKVEINGEERIVRHTVHSIADKVQKVLKKWGHYIITEKSAKTGMSGMEWLLLSLVQLKMARYMDNEYSTRREQGEEPSMIVDDKHTRTPDHNDQEKAARKEKVYVNPYTYDNSFLLQVLGWYIEGFEKYPARTRRQFTKGANKAMNAFKLKGVRQQRLFAGAVHVVAEQKWPGGCILEDVSDVLGQERVAVGNRKFINPWRVNVWEDESEDSLIIADVQRRMEEGESMELAKQYAMVRYERLWLEYLDMKALAAKWWSQVADSSCHLLEKAGWEGQVPLDAKAPVTEAALMDAYEEISDMGIEDDFDSYGDYDCDGYNAVPEGMLDSMPTE